MSTAKLVEFGKVLAVVVVGLALLQKYAPSLTPTALSAKLP